MKTLISVMSLFTLSFSILAAPLKPDTNELLYHYCHMGDSELEKTVTIGQGKKVMYHQGPFMQVNASTANQAIKNLIQDKLTQVSESADCAQYLLSRTKFVEGKLAREVLARVTFDFDDDELNQKSRYLLLNLIAKLEHQTPEFIVTGNTDSKGSDSYNLSLGLQRSNVVVGYLKEQGVNIEDLTVSSQGEANPVQSNETESGRHNNRRVDIHS
ncbi:MULTISPECIES: OmpA family protein [Vibrio]|uniref:OmpA family protein n=1 Tax=Vibrio tasmaniensis TaxID=212663 RepID=A0A2N7NGA3_9VIBR|nr:MULTISPECIES: OmpA family protein [Vibrio]EAQ53220.1 outer membrane protein [Vibrio sp. MED222]PMP13415.1 hypothetical protein BCS92_17245 [Vibrio tasmaniensis]TKG37462.1 OmpA family protein [Vibrio tasmaniensis]TKG40654.1 OmpA family protein [Vibrio tasmaniensis]TKG48302.1 OmpA family protein [Vibrio tasmaniensis]